LFSFLSLAEKAAMMVNKYIVNMYSKIRLQEILTKLKIQTEGEKPPLNLEHSISEHATQTREKTSAIWSY
jgi:hypothetical protein